MSRISSVITGVGLALAFAALAALSTVVVWVLLSLPTAEPFAIDSLGFASMAAGVAGPVLVLFLVRRATRTTATPQQQRLRIASAIGAVTILIIEILYLIVLGIMTLAYSGVRM